MLSSKSRRPTIWTLLGSLLIWTILGSGCGSNKVVEPLEQTMKDVTAKEAFDLIETSRNDPDFVILDVRTPEEFSEGHIEQAINLDYRSETFREELDKLDKSKTYLMHCKSGGRSTEALVIMEELNFPRIYHMNDGILGWEAEGFPVVPSP